MTIDSNPDTCCYAPIIERDNFVFACKIKLNDYTCLHNLRYTSVMRAHSLRGGKQPLSATGFYTFHKLGIATSSHTKFHHRYHIVWVTKYRYKVLTPEMRYRIRDITRQICSQMGVTIIKGVLSADHVHLFVEIPPKVSISDFMRRVKGCTSRKIQQEFPELRRRYWGRRFWARGFFSTTSGNITNETILNYIEQHQPTDDSR